MTTPFRLPAIRGPVPRIQFMRWGILGLGLASVPLFVMSGSLDTLLFGGLSLRALAKSVGAAIGTYRPLESDRVAERAAATIHRGKPWWRRFFASLRVLYFPTGWSATWLGLLGTLIIVTSWFVGSLVNNNSALAWLSYMDGNPPLEATAAICAIALSLVLLIAEGFGEQDPASSGHVLLRESMAFPLLVLTILVLLAGLFPSHATVANALFTVAIAALVILSLYRTILARLSPARLAAKRLDLLHEQAVSATRAILLGRAGSGHLRGALSSMDGVRQAPSERWVIGENKVVLWRTRRAGTVTDVRLDRVRALLRIARGARQPVPAVHPVQGQPVPVPSGQPVGVPIVHLLFDFGDSVEPPRAGVAVTSAVPLEGNLVGRLQQVAATVYVISDARPPTREYEHLLDLVEERALAAIARRSYPSTLIALREFHALVDGYLTELRSLGVWFTRASTRAEWARLTGLLPAVDAAPRSLERIIEAAARNGLDILALVAGMPSQLARDAIVGGDYMAVDGFLRVLRGLLQIRARLQGPRRRQILLRAMKRGLRDVAIGLRAERDHEQEV